MGQSGPDQSEQGGHYDECGTLDPPPRNVTYRSDREPPILGVRAKLPKP